LSRARLDTSGRESSKPVGTGIKAKEVVQPVAQHLRLVYATEAATRTRSQTTVGISLAHMFIEFGALVEKMTVLFRWCEALVGPAFRPAL
jgi:hypothetical protein